MWAVWCFMADQEWHTLREIDAACPGYMQALTARLRDFRKKKFGAHTMNSRCIGGGTWEYQVIPNPNVKVAAR